MVSGAQQSPKLADGGGARYPYPKQVWSPAGGWWTRPASWRRNTAIVFGGILLITYGVWTISAAKERRDIPPAKRIPSMMWTKQYQDKPEDRS